jgi:hypothetical protein
MKEATMSTMTYRTQPGNLHRLLLLLLLLRTAPKGSQQHKKGEKETLSVCQVGQTTQPKLGHGEQPRLT